MMKKLLIEVGELTDKEYARANEQYPAFASDHEGHDVMTEEIEEAEEELENIHSIEIAMKFAIRKNSAEDVNKTAMAMYETAQKMAAESIQVAAMAQKIIESRQLRKTKKWPALPMLEGGKG